jgi:glycosyltransferase involved in cell wall biosynthesis
MKKKFCLVATFEMPIKAFFLDHIKAMRSKYDITVVVNTTNTNFLKSVGINVTVISVAIERKISLWRDIKALINLYGIFRRYKFDVVHSIMPKSGLLAMSAAFFARIPIRIHIFTGQVWATRTGLMRRLLKSMDRLIVFLSTNILVDSRSQKEFIVDQGIVSESKALVLANGSVSGVDTQRFSPNPRIRANIRKQYDISESEVVFLFLGRLNRDKGVLDLAAAFVRVYKDFKKVRLMLVGHDEEDMRSRITALYGQHVSAIHFIDHTEVPEQYMAAADIFCIPSYREGFGSVVIESAAIGIPAIGSRIYGITDAIEDGVTGLLYKVGDVNSLIERMVQFLENPVLREKMGEAARKRAIRDFSKEIVISAMLGFYESLF